jgi:hypothetical protein
VPINQPSQEPELSTIEKAILILDNEGEIIQVERDLREIQVLADRGVAEAGTLQSHEGLKAGLEALQEPLEKLAVQIDALEAQTMQVLASYNDYVSFLDACKVKKTHFCTDQRHVRNLCHPERNHYFAGASRRQAGGRLIRSRQAVSISFHLDLALLHQLVQNLFNATSSSGQYVVWHLQPRIHELGDSARSRTSATSLLERSTHSMTVSGSLAFSNASTTCSSRSCRCSI